MPSHAQLSEILDTVSTALLTVECQQGVVGPDSALPELALAARSSGALANVARLVAAAHESGVQVIHALAERRPDGRGANHNARLFRAAERLPVQQPVLAGHDRDAPGRHGLLRDHAPPSQLRHAARRLLRQPDDALPLGQPVTHEGRGEIEQLLMLAERQAGMIVDRQIRDLRFSTDRHPCHLPDRGHLPEPASLRNLD